MIKLGNLDIQGLYLQLVWVLGAHCETELEQVSLFDLGLLLLELLHAVSGQPLCTHDTSGLNLLPRARNIPPRQPIPPLSSQPHSHISTKFSLINKDSVTIRRHLLGQLCGNAARVDAVAEDPLVAVFGVDEFAESEDA